MAADLPGEFDVVVLGTGLTESVIAAACSRVGQRVLHVDRRSYYAGNWASFTFNGLLSWMEECKQGGQSSAEEATDWGDKLEEGEEALVLSVMDTSITNLEVFCYASEEPEEEEKEADASRHTPAPVQAEGEQDAQSDSPTCPQEVPEGDAPQEGQGQIDGLLQDGAEEAPGKDEEAASPETSQAREVQGEEPSANPSPTEVKKISYAKIVKEGRRFNIDLVSKLLYSRGLLVDLLIKSNVSRYAEFKNVSRILTYRDGKLEQVPCSRADVFGSKQLTMVEKRMLMKFLTFCLDYEEHPEEYLDFTERSFWDFLQTKKLTDNIQHFLLHSIAMVPPETRTGEGLRSTQYFLRSLGRYSNTPFLFPIYGLGEIPQCFCRMCAVFGGTYCLRHSVRCLVLDKESGRCKAVIDTCGQRISCSHFVLEKGYVPEERRKGAACRQISRGVLITDRSLLPSETEQQLSLITVPPLEPGAAAVRITELCSSTMTCMPGTYLVHLTCLASGSAHADLAPVVSRLFTETPGDTGAADAERPAVLWALYFNMRNATVPSTASYDLPANVHVCPGPDGLLGNDHSIRLAEEVFHRIVPDEEFCPPAPNPEDIIFEGVGPQGEGAGIGEPSQGEDAAEAGQEDDVKTEAAKDESLENAGSGEAAGQESGVEAQEAAALPSAPPPTPPTDE
ncbi:rab proteins geranylgeranyltransferase component A 1 isoform X1 [Paramormyrops kingsleyae]|uniref:rab proteins geranylgeranyltransferase component A 1 isoform X1 n=3 Tax=Paramormyrops kingsleyae TaxID=1676925 RepID=UPI003B97350B